MAMNSTEILQLSPYDFYNPPIISKRNPTINDKAPLGSTGLGQIWVNKAANTVFVLTSVVNNHAIWTQLGGATGTFTSVTASTGNIVATLGNISTTAGSITSATTVTATVGNVTATNGNFLASTADTGLQLGVGGPIVVCGAGVPTAAAAQGSLYLRTDGSSTSTRLYVRGTAGWIAITTAS